MSPNHEIAARPLASWRMCVTSNDVGNKDQDVVGASDSSDDDDNIDASTPSGSLSISPAAKEEPLVVAYH